MLKFIGLAVMASGMILLILAIVTGKRSGIDTARKELALIMGAGYADMHRETPKGARINEEKSSRKNNIKVAPKKRTLSKEAKEILAMVEKEKAEERKSSAKPLAEGTAVMKEKKQSPATDVLTKPEEGKSGTDVLHRDHKQQDSTDVLDRVPRQTHDTDVLSRETGDSTDILKRDKAPAEKTDVLKTRSKEVPEDKGTDILQRKSPEQTESGTDILERR